jgi:hypothetical protein
MVRGSNRLQVESYRFQVFIERGLLQLSTCSLQPVTL